MILTFHSSDVIELLTIDLLTIDLLTTYHINITLLLLRREKIFSLSKLFHFLDSLFYSHESVVFGLSQFA